MNRTRCPGFAVVTTIMLITMLFGMGCASAKYSTLPVHVRLAQTAASVGETVTIEYFGIELSPDIRINEIRQEFVSEGRDESTRLELIQFRVVPGTTSDYVMVKLMNAEGYVNAGLLEIVEPEE